MKALKISLIAVFLVAFLCGGLVSAATVTLNSDQASVRFHWVAFRLDAFGRVLWIQFIQYARHCR